MYILFDIGKTKTRVAASRDLESFGEPKIFDTPKDYLEAVAAVTLAAKEVSLGEKIEHVGGGVAGPLGVEKQSLAEDINFPGWVGRPLCGDLWAALGAPVFLENDSALVGLGEAVSGAGKKYNIVAYVTISTGVGGARIIDKKIDTNSIGFEPGWQAITLDGKFATDYLSGAATEKETGKKPFEISDPVFWDTKARILAYFLNNIIVMWSPDIVVIGGSMVKEVGISISETEKYLHQILRIFPKIPRIIPAELNDVGGLYGAMEFLKDKRHI